MAPRPDLITPLGWDMLETLPPILRDDPTNRAIIHCSAKESERLDATLDDLRLQFNPITAGVVGLSVWERLLHLPDGSALALAGRRVRVLGRYRALSGDPSAQSWVLRVSGRLGGAPWTYVEHDPADISTPPAHVLRVVIPATPGTPAWDRITGMFREETPAEIDFEFISGEGFLLDVDPLDVGVLGI